MCFEKNKIDRRMPSLLIVSLNIRLRFIPLNILINIRCFNLDASYESQKCGRKHGSSMSEICVLCLNTRFLR